MPRFQQNSGRLPPRGRGHGFQFFLRRSLVGAVDRGRLRESLLRLGASLQIQERKSQTILVARIASVIRFQERRGRPEIRHRLRVIFFLNVDLPQRTQRQSFLQPILRLPLLVRHFVWLFCSFQPAQCLLCISLGLIQLFALLSVVIGQQQ